MRICYKWEWNAHADRTLNINSAKLKQYYYFHAEFLEEIRYAATGDVVVFHNNIIIQVSSLCPRRNYSNGNASLTFT